MLTNSCQLWTAYALSEIRRLDLTAARKVFGTAIGLCPKPKLFNNYIQMEIQLREFDRCRTLYQKFLEVSPAPRFRIESFADFWLK